MNFPIECVDAEMANNNETPVQGRKTSTTSYGLSRDSHKRSRAHARDSVGSKTSYPTIPIQAVNADDTQRLADGLSELLLRIVNAPGPSVGPQPQQNNNPSRGTKTIFDGSRGRAPTISLYDFTLRVSRHSGCTRAALVAALVYLDRLMVKHPFLTLTETNVHRLLWTCVVVAIKYFEDSFYSNAYYSKVGGVTLVEMNHLEVTLLLALGFDLFVTPKQYQQYDDALTSSCDYAAVRKAQREASLTLAAMVCPAHYMQPMQISPPVQCTSTTQPMKKIPASSS
ncbi:cyclin family protein [Pelomyxa schiedti]|nr:cyclin family protein [Pelomyxa schiedti]